MNDPNEQNDTGIGVQEEKEALQRPPDLKPGHAVDIKPEHRRVIAALMDRGNDISSAVELAGRMERDAMRSLFRFIEGVYPELKPYHLHVDLRTNKITVTYKKSEWVKTYEEEIGGEGENP